MPTCPHPDRPAGAVLLTPDGSRHGAAAQARHVFVEGTGTHLHPAPRVLEVGFGLGVDFRATVAGAALESLAYEADPAPASVLREVALGQEGEDHPVWSALLGGWGRHLPLTVQGGGVTLTVQFKDVLTAELPPGWATALYFGGFLPAHNPEVWTPAFVARLARSLAPGGVLATYSAAGHVRRALEAAGLRVEKRPGPPGKRECLRALREAGE